MNSFDTISDSNGDVYFITNKELTELFNTKLVNTNNGQSHV